MSDKPTFVYEPDSEAGSFVMLIAKELHPTVDGRMFAAGAIDHRELPIPLTLQRRNNKDGQHKGASGIGAVTEIWRDGTDIYGRGYFSSDEEGQKARQLIAEGTISGVSADVGGVTSEELTAGVEYPEGVSKVITKGTIIGVTALLHASFNETKIAVEEAPVTAAGGAPWTPPAEMFVNPKLTGPTPLTVTADGRVYGHAAIWGTCHVGYRDRCVTPPRSPSNYAYFNTGTVLTADANAVHVGRITAGTGHASMELSAQPAKAHYDDTGYCAAFVAAGEDEYGIWFSGVVAPDATESQIANMRAAGVSGDWRSIGGNLEMVGLLAVNTPGFPVPKPKIGLVAGAQVSLVAAGYVDPKNDDEHEEDPAYSEGGAEHSISDKNREKVLILADGEEEMAKKKPCCSECADGKPCAGEDEEMSNCGCDGVEFETVEFMMDHPIEWSNDLDRAFIASVLQSFTEISDLGRQAMDSGSALSSSVQTFAAELTSKVEDHVRFLERSLGRPVNETDDEDNDVPDSAYEAQVALLDLDMEVFVMSDPNANNGRKRTTSDAGRKKKMPPAPKQKPKPPAPKPKKPDVAVGTPPVPSAPEVAVGSPPVPSALRRRPRK